MEKVVQIQSVLSLLSFVKKTPQRVQGDLGDHMSQVFLWTNGYEIKSPLSGSNCGWKNGFKNVR